MLWRRRQPAAAATLNAIAIAEAEIRSLQSEERMLRQELGLPPITDDNPARWIEQALAPARGYRTRARRGSGFSQYRTH